MKRASWREDITGCEYGQLTVLGFSHLGSWQRQYWHARCTCGTEKTIERASLVKGRTRSCGCLQRQAASNMAKARTLPDDGAVLNSIYKQYRRHAATRNLNFDLSSDDFKLLVGSECYYCGTLGSNVRKYRGTEVRINGIDREDNSIGYQLGNVVPCCRACNSGKGTLTKDEFIALATRIAHKWADT